MLPPGHVAAGYLTAEAVLKIVPYRFPLHQQLLLALWGMFWGFAPDLDTFYTFWKVRSFNKTAPTEVNHRNYVSHAPVIWLAAGLAVFAAAHSPFCKTLGLLIWLGSWSHFVLDSIQYGIMWLWPLSFKRFAFLRVDEERFNAEMQTNQGGFFKYWIGWTKIYSKYLAVSVTLELIIIISALFTALR